MIDFRIAVLLTVIVSAATVLVDWLAFRFVSVTRTLRAIQRIMNSGLSESDAQAKIELELQRQAAAQAGSLTWGADLATVAVAMDFTALGVWVHNSTLFPFFARFNGADVGREIPVWLIVIGIHGVCLLGSVILKQLHGHSIEARPTHSQRNRALRWLLENRWMLAANTVGFVALLSSIVVFTNAWRQS